MNWQTTGRMLYAATALVLAWGWAGAAISVEESTGERPAASDRAARLAERDRLWEQAKDHAAAGDRTAAVAAAEQIVAIEIELFGEVSSGNAFMHGWIGDQHFAAAHFHAAAASYDRRVEILAALSNAKPWVLTDARQAAASARLRAGLDEAERRKLAAADALRRQLTAKYRSGDFREAAVLAERALALKQDVLGENHIDTASAIDVLARLYRLAGDYERAMPLYEQALEIRQAVLGGEHPDTAKSLNGVALVHQLMGNYAQALSLQERALKITKAAFGEKHDSTATAMNNLAAIYDSMGEYARALPLYEQALAITREVVGEQHVDTATSLNNLALLHQVMGDYPRAVPLYQEAIAIRREIQGDDHPDTAVALNNLAYLYQLMGEHDRALRLYQQSLSLRQTALGDEHPDTIATLNNLALLYQAMGRYSDSQPLLERALVITHRTFGEDHPQTANLLNNLGALYQRLGEYSRALPLLERALAIRQRILGFEHAETAASLNNLAYLHQMTGEYARALPLFEQTLAIRKKVLGELHPDTAMSLNNLALLHADMGEGERALQLQEQALTVRRQVLGETHPDVAASLNNLAMLCQSTGAFARAEALFEQALAIQEEVLGSEHPDTATTLNNLAGVHHVMGRYAAALTEYERALAARKRSLGAEHPDTAASLNNLASLRHSLGDFGEAAVLYQQALAIWKDRLGGEHPNTTMLGISLAAAQAAQDDQDEALEALLASAAAERQWHQRQLFALSDARIRSVLSGSRPIIDVLASLPLADLNAQDEAFAVLLSRKAIAFEVLNLRRATAYLAEADEQVRLLRSQLDAAQTRLETLALRPPAGVTEDDLAARRAALRDEIQRLDEQLSRKLAAFLGTDVSLAVSLDQLRAAMAPRAAHIEYFRYAPCDVTATGEAPRWLPARYAAFVLTNTAAKPVRLVDLGPAADVDGLIDELAEHVQDYQRLAGGLADEVDYENDYREIAGALSGKLFGPLHEALGDAREITLGPDGRLHELAFEALLDDTGQYLIEAGYRFAYVNSGRDLLRARGALGEGVAVIAGPDYALGYEQRLALAVEVTSGATTPLAQREPAAATSPGIGRSVSRAADTRRGWRDLGEAALAEGQEAAAAFANADFGVVATYMRGLALEEVVKRLVSPRVLVLITHGDFLENEPAANPAVGGTRSFLETTADRGGAGLARTGLRAAEDPFLRSYLVLAGANEIDEPIPADVRVENGWLTAREIAQLDLRGTDLVVLSACSTNRGDANNRQAVMGMRSAFLFAGARTIVGSLFEVPNAETRQLLKPFYEGVAAGRGKLAALNSAKLQFIDQRREIEGAAHPFYWASFILVGEP